MIMEPMRVLYLGPENATDTVRANLPASWEVIWAIDDAGVDAALPGCVAVLDAYMKIRFSAERLARATRLQAFVTATTGADHVAHAALEERGIPLLTLRGQGEVLRNITPAAEHSWLLLLACARGLRGAVNEVLEGGWERNNHPGLMLRGRTLGILGCGRIGGWMSRYATAFGMHVLGYDPHAAEFPDTIAPTGLDDLLEGSDIISVHVPLTPETQQLLGRAELRRMRPGVIIVNTSRGDIIDETALLECLEDGHVSAAGLDVLTGEPETADHPLVRYARTHPNLVITPHIGGFSPDALGYVLAFSCQRLVRAVETTAAPVS